MSRMGGGGVDQKGFDSVIPDASTITRTHMILMHRAHSIDLSALDGERGRVVRRPDMREAKLETARASQLEALLFQKINSRCQRSVGMSSPTSSSEGSVRQPGGATLRQLQHHIGVSEVLRLVVRLKHLAMCETDEPVHHSMFAVTEDEVKSALQILPIPAGWDAHFAFLSGSVPPAFFDATLERMAQRWVDECGRAVVCEGACVIGVGAHCDAERLMALALVAAIG